MSFAARSPPKSQKATKNRMDMHQSLQHRNGLLEKWASRLETTRILTKLTLQLPGSAPVASAIKGPGSKVVS